MKADTEPVSRAARISSIDTLRGVALLGILLMNIQSFSMVAAAYTDPSVQMDLGGVNLAVWAASHVFADMKFMAIFSMLYGAGIVLMVQKRDVAGQGVFVVHLVRSFWLLIFGMIHAYLIWYGDILVTYALCGMVVFGLRGLSPRLLLVLGLAVLSVAPALTLAALMAPPSEISAIAASFTATPTQVVLETAAYRGNWLDAHQARVISAAALQLGAFPYFFLWRASGLMLIGMALFKWGVLSGALSRRQYRRMGLGALVVGVPLTVTSALYQISVGWDARLTQLGPASLLNYYGSLAMALAYVAGVMLVVRSGTVARWQARLAAVGRMAFTNYMAQSVICTGLFYGFGLGLFGMVERWQQLLVVLGIWALQLAVSPWWLERFQFGPLEWLWRSLTYRQWQPMRQG